MSRLSLLTVTAAMVAIVSSGVQAQRPTASSSVAIEHVTVIDPVTGARAVDQNVVVHGNRIVAVGSAAAVKSPAGAPIVDGRGKFLIPGIWDMHAHPFHNFPARVLPVAVARGITGIREMGSGIQNTADGTKLIDDGLLAPRMIVSGPALDGVQPGNNLPPGADLAILTPDEGREVVNRLVALRVNFIKVHNQLSRETFLAIAEEAKRWHMPFDGHLATGMTIVEASDAGQRTVEHMAALQPSCAKDPSVLRPPARGAEPSTAPIELDRAKCEETLRHLARNGTWFSPTIGGPGQGNARVRAFNLTLVQMAAKAQVKLLPATDWPGGGYWRGDYGAFDRSPQDDLAGMVEAGVSPLDALRIGTVNPARLLNLSDQLGQVKAGFLADLVVLDADPLVDIQNLKRVYAVVANGRLVDAAMRQKAITDERATRKPAANP